MALKAEAKKTIQVSQETYVLPLPSFQEGSSVLCLPHTDSLYEQQLLLWTRERLLNDVLLKVPWPRGLGLHWPGFSPCYFAAAVSQP